MKKHVINVCLCFVIIALSGVVKEGLAVEWVYPVGDPNSNTLRVTQSFMNYYPDKETYHVGVDIGRGRTGNINYEPNNKTVRSVARGRVIYIGTGYNIGWGNTIVIRHDFLNSPRYIFSSYSHLEDNSLKVTENEIVQPGQPIGIMGETGNSEGIHLHFMLFTTENGDSLWDNFITQDLGISYLSRNYLPVDYNIGDFITYGETTFYDPLLFIKFSRLASISPPSIQKYNVNNDFSDTSSIYNEPSPIRIGNNTVSVTVATYRKEISMWFELRNYTGESVAGKMLLTDSGYSGWIMSDEFDPLGRDCEDGGWNCERILTYTYNFSIKSRDSTGVDMSVFWKPLWYDSTMLILPVPGGVAYNTTQNTGRYVHRPIE